MRWNRPSILIVLALAVVVAMTACGPKGPGAEDIAQQEEWAWLEEAKAELDAKRVELAEAKMAMMATMAMPEEGEEPVAEEDGEEGTEGEETAEAVDPAVLVEELSEEVLRQSDEFGGRLIGFLNAVPMIEGELPTESQMAALRMKSDEDMVLAAEWIEKGGDYKRAIEIYKVALTLDPDNEAVIAAMAEAEAMRFMTEERLVVVEKGMTEVEVRGLLGTPNTYNVKEYEERNATAWFYPTADDGAASAVWFRPDKEGAKKVYQVEFEAVKGRNAESEEAE